MLPSTNNTPTMSSSQLAEMLGYEKKEVNRKVREMFADKIDGGIIPPSLDSRGYVVEYHLPELESKMFVAKHDINYLEEITRFWINGTVLVPPPPQSKLEWIQFSLEQEKQLISAQQQLEVTQKRLVSKSNPLPLSQIIKYRGFVNHVYRHLEAIGYVVRTSHWEGKGWKLTQKGLDSGYGVQVTPTAIKWLPEIIEILPEEASRKRQTPEPETYEWNVPVRSKRIN